MQDLHKELNLGGRRSEPKNSIVVIGWLERPPMLRHCEGRAPSSVFQVITGPLPLPVREAATRIDWERHVIDFAGEEAGALFQRLRVGQRLLIHASPKVPGAPTIVGGRGAAERSELEAHTVRILPEEASTIGIRGLGRPGADGVESEWRRRFLAGFFLRLRAQHGATAGRPMPESSRS